MIKAKVGFIVYGIHKDGLLDPMGTPSIDSRIVAGAKKALKNSGIDVAGGSLILQMGPNPNKKWGIFGLKNSNEIINK